MVSFGDSKHETVKPLQRILNLTPSKLALSAKCTIHDVTHRTSLTISSLCLFSILRQIFHQKFHPFFSRCQYPLIRHEVSQTSLIQS